MSTAIIDAREWQNVFDLKTGQKITDDRELVTRTAEVLARHPYPGDVEEQSNRWVSDTALDLIAAYDPQLVCLSYAQQYFAQRFSPVTPQQCQRMTHSVFEEVGRFADLSGFTPLIVGTGDMTDLKEEIDLSRLDGLAITTAWSARYAGLHDPSARDMDLVADLSQLERIVPLEEWIALFDIRPENMSRMPQYLLVSREGYGFRTGGATLRRPHRIPAPTHAIPVSPELAQAEDITKIGALVERRAAEEKTALVILEGIGKEDFTEAYGLVANGRDWCVYEPGEGQYLTMTCGSHQLFTYPPGYPLYEEDDETTPYPFSGYFNAIPQDTLGKRFAGRSMAVGNRSMFTHMIYGVDVSIECFARNLFNQGCLGVIHRTDK
jgi:hypothetical protein